MVIKVKKNTVVAIDGPVGSGKSTISRKAAEKLGFIYVDTGALYRALGVFFEEKRIDFNTNVKVDIRFIDKEQRVFVDDTDYTDKIRTPKASMLASAVSAKPEVREFLLELQRSFAKNNSVIMDGRDIGTVVLPDADIKIFLTADAKERAKRRYDELILKGTSVEFDDVLKDLEKRDYDDSHREHAPLKKADDAIVADTTGNTFNESVALVLKIIEDRL
ncbi:MAG: (d)CMP kinase [Oscillospiraceae bacterium]|nr:(d)CMP kinase [Oscillospiraceae bacterium]